MTTSLGPKLLKLLLKGLSVLTFSWHQMLALRYQRGGGIANNGRGKKRLRNGLSDAALCTAACAMSAASSWASVHKKAFFFPPFSSVLLTGQVFSKHMCFSGGLALLLEAD